MGFIKTAENENKAQAQKNSRLKSYVKYSHLPGIFPRIRELGKKFSHFAYLLATIYGAVGLIPRAHPVLNPANVGKFGFRDVLGAASQNLVMSWKNIDQILVFFAIIFGLITLAIQLAIVFFAGLTSTAFASSVSAGFFDTPAGFRDTDVVLIFLEQIFGDVGVFNIGAPGVGGNTVHSGLHQMLGFYSQAMMVFAAIIVVYYVVTVLAEAAQSGTPFGRRFNSIWAPIRLVVALGLLVPLGGHLNAAQYITLHIAKMGSGLATNAWTVFASEIYDDDNRLLMEPSVTSIAGLVEGIYLSEVCAAALNQVEALAGGSSANLVQKYVIFTTKNPRGYSKHTVQAYTTFSAALAAAREADSTNLRLVWAVDGANKHNKSNQCGDVIFSMTENQEENSFSSFLEPFLSIDLHDDLALLQLELGATAVDTIIAEIASTGVAQDTVQAYYPHGIPALKPDLIDQIEPELTEITIKAQEAVSEVVQEAYDNFGSGDIVLSEMLKRGWGGAGLWYTTIGKVNQAFLTVTSDLPAAGVFDITNMNSSDSSVNKQGNKPSWDWFWTSQQTIDHRDDLVAMIVNLKRTHIEAALPRSPEEEKLADDGWINTVLVYVFQLQRLEQMRAVATLDPMIALQAVGYDTVERSMNLLTWAVGGTMLSPLANFLGPVSEVVSGLLGAAVSIIMMLALLGLAVGLLLFYLLPIFPFMYFFFAIVGWILEIFEAIIGMPLWALGHLRIDGDGFAGQGAMNGYLLLFAILTRPLFIVFGLIGGYIAFGAGAYLLQSLYAPLVSNVQGGSFYGLSQFVYTLIFAYLVYQLGLLCFKMIDTVPQNIIRWMGQSVQTFNDNRADPIGGSTGFILAGTGIMSQAQSALGGATQSVKGGFQSRKSRIESDNSARIAEERHRDLMSK